MFPSKRVTVPVALLATLVLAAGLAWSQTPKALSEENLVTMIKLGVDDAAIGSMLQKQGIGFAVDEAALERLKKDGASEAVLAAVRKAGAPKPAAGAPDNAITYQNVLDLLQRRVPEEQILKRLEQSPTLFTLDAAQVEELKKAGASETLLAALPGKRDAHPNVEITDFAIILDCSASMAEPTKEGPAKMTVAKRVVTELVQKIPEGLNLAFLIYGHDKDLKCQAVKVARPMSVLDAGGRAELVRMIAGLQPEGATPIALALRAAGAELARGDAPGGLVLISDGKETCGGNPAAEAATLAANPKLTFGVNVIGFDVRPEERAALEEIARAGKKGKYYNPTTAAEFREVVQAIHQEVVKNAKPARPSGLVVKIEPIARILIERLKDPDGSVRRSAAEGLQKMGAKSAVPALMERVSDDVWYISGYTNVPDDPFGGGKTAALDALKKLAPDKVSEALIAATRSKRVEVRVWALGELVGWKDDTRAEAIVEALVRALGDAGGSDADRTARMVRAGRHIRRVAAEGLQKLGAKSAVPALMERVGDDVWYISGYSNVPDDPIGGGKAAALDALKQLAPDKVSEALVPALKSKVPALRRWAASQLETFGDETAVPALMERVGDDVWYISGYTNVPDDPIGGGKAAALVALKKLAPDKITEALAVAMRSKTAEVRAWAEDQVIQFVNPKEDK